MEMTGGAQMKTCEICGYEAKEPMQEDGNYYCSVCLSNNILNMKYCSRCGVRSDKLWMGIDSHKAVCSTCYAKQAKAYLKERYGTTPPTLTLERTKESIWLNVEDGYPDRGLIERLANLIIQKGSL